MLGQLFALTSVGLVVYWFSRDGKTLRHYETTFVDTYGNLYANSVIPSDFREAKDPYLLAKLCGHSAIRRNLLTRSRLKLEVHPISFKRIRRPPLIAEVVRCKRRTAIIQAPTYNGHDCAYFLRMRKGPEDTQSFYIYQKFCYIDKKIHRIKRSLSGEENVQPERDDVSDYSASVLDKA